MTEEKEPNTHILTDSGIANKQYVYTENNSFRTKRKKIIFCLDIDMIFIINIY